MTIVWTAAAITTSCRNVDLTAQHDRSASVASALERGYLEREDGMMFIRGGPLSDELRSSRRFADLLKRLQLHPL